MIRYCLAFAAAILIMGSQTAQAAFTFQVAADQFGDPAGAVGGVFSVADLNGNTLIDQPQEFLSWSFTPTGFSQSQGFFAISDSSSGASPVRVGPGPETALAFGLFWTGAVFEVSDPGVIDVIIGVDPDGSVDILNGETGASDRSPGSVQPIPVPPMLPLLVLLLGGGLIRAHRAKQCNC